MLFIFSINMLSHLLNNNHTILLLGEDHLIPGGGMVFCEKKFVQQKMENK